MLSRETEQKLVQIFITISVGEEKINKFKQNILTNFSINPIQFFFKLDTENSNYISKNDISNFLNSFSIVYSPIDIDFIFYFYDKDFDNVLNFYEFLNLLISDSNYLYKKSFKKKYKHNKFDQNDLNKDIDIDIHKSVIQILIEEIELARQLNDLILDIKQNNDFIIQNIFYEIKSYSYITNESLKAFFDRNEVNYNDKFIKNIFSRFDNREINGRISFNKFKNFFDLPYNKNINENINLNNKINENYVQSEIPKTINQTHFSEDINLNNSINHKPNYDYEEKFNNINKNVNYINEEDIQFECCHVSRSGSVQSKNIKNKNCGYVSKKNKNNSYKNYLREKRSKSLEKSLSRSLSRASEAYQKLENKKNKERNKNNIRNIRVIADDDNNNSMNEGMNMSNSKTSYNEDIPIKLPARLDKNLVQRTLPKKSNKKSHNNQNKNIYNFCYNKYSENCDYKHNHTQNNSKYYNNYFDENVMQNESDLEKPHYGINERIGTKIYEEDFCSNRINSGLFE